MIPVDQSGSESIGTAVAMLRDATATVHERLHSHPVFLPIMSGQIDRTEYVDLLLALYGFHSGFERVVAAGGVRCRRLAEDLRFFDVEVGEMAPTYRATLAAAANEAERWGIDYVLRGATLGGRVLARKLDGLLGRGALAGRRFLSDGGESSGAQWHSFIEQLERSLPKRGERLAAAAAAVTTFDEFEKWMTHTVANRPIQAGVAYG